MTISEVRTYLGQVVLPIVIGIMWVMFCRTLEGSELGGKRSSILKIPKVIFTTGEIYGFWAENFIHRPDKGWLTMNCVNVSQTCCSQTARSPRTAELNVRNLLFLFLCTDFFNKVPCNMINFRWNYCINNFIGHFIFHCIFLGYGAGGRLGIGGTDSVMVPTLLESIQHIFIKKVSFITNS